MGLLESLLNVPQELRVWQMSGVRYFLLPEQGGTSESPPPQPDPTTWPSPWADYFAKCPAHPRLVLTYFQLGQDIFGRSDQRRSRLWRRLIQELHWTGQNKIAFWPIGLPKDARIEPYPDLFLQAMSILAPQGIAVFGENAADVLALDRAGDAPTLAGLPCGIFPDPDVLLDGDKEVWDHVLAWFGRW